MHLFSVIIPTFNRASLLSRAINSVLSQSFTDYEIIIVDDGSTDETKSIIDLKFKSSVHYVYQKNSGVCSARNHGAKLAIGEYLIFLDSDDWLSNNCLQLYFNAISSESVLLVLGTINFFNTDTNKVKTIVPKNKGTYYSHGLPGSFALQRNVFLKVGGYDENLVYSENSDLFYRLRNENFISMHQVALSLNAGVYKEKEKATDRRKRYAAKRYDNIKYFMAKHHVLFSNNPVALNSYQRTLAVCAVLVGKNAEARRLVYENFKRNPFSFKSIGQCILFSLPQLARYYYTH